MNSSEQAASASVRSSARGLTSGEAARRLQLVGPNEPLTIRKPSAVRNLLRRFANSLVAILVLASAASALLKDTLNASLLLCNVVVSVVVDFSQTRRSQRAADGLKAQVAGVAVALRDDRSATTIQTTRGGYLGG